MATDSSKKFFLKTYRLVTIHPLQTTTTDRLKDRRQPYYKLDRLDR